MYGYTVEINGEGVDLPWFCDVCEMSENDVDRFDNGHTCTICEG